jgi:uncharacterized protein
MSTRNARRLAGGALAAALSACAQPVDARHDAARADSLPLALFEYDRAAPLDVRDSPVRTVQGVEVRAVSFASPGGGRATGYLAVPLEASGRLTGIVLLHGMPGSAGQMIPRAVYLARHGAAVLALDAPFARRSGGPVTLSPQDSAEQVQLVVDLQRAVDVLLARDDVDPARLAYVGGSYGGAMGALFAGVERRLETYVLMVADGGLVSHFTGPDDGPGPPGPVSADQWRRWLAAMRPIEPLRFVPRAAPASLLFQSGRLDQLVPVADAEAVQRAASEPKTVKWYDSGHALPPAAAVDQLVWLHETVGTTPPGPADEAGPSALAADERG